ncbi:MAG: lytic transglycosylase domain-containing protein [Deltaproteobacteria bacterium]|nr:lytic transglycosylase domain-containing protein [Deltaproteobacteria bacterium]
MGIDPLRNNVFVSSSPTRPSSGQVSVAGGQNFAQVLAAEKTGQKVATPAEQAATMLKLARLQLMRGLFFNEEETEHGLDLLSAVDLPSVASQKLDKLYDRLQPTLLETEKSRRNDIDRMIDQVAEQVSLAPELIRSVVAAESNFQPDAVSTAGAQGLMQLMPATAQELGVEDSFDPQQNLLGGSRYLKQLLDKYAGDLDRALAAYNWGQGNVDRKGLRQMPPETREYLARVKARLPRQV